MTNEKISAEEIDDADLDSAAGGFTATDDLWKVREGATQAKADDDGAVSSLDALLVINTLSRRTG